MFTRLLLALWAYAATVTFASSPPLSTRDSATASFVHPFPAGNLTFAVTTVKENGDLYFHLEAPAKHQWIAVGMGGGMTTSLILVAYRSKDGKGVTLSPRIAQTHTEPSYFPSRHCEIITDGVINGVVKHGDRGLLVVNGRCEHVNNLQLERRHANNGGDHSKFEFSNPKQPFIFALGPTDRTLRSDAKDAGIRRHSTFGWFEMDLTKATVDAADDVDMEILGATGSWQNQNSRVRWSPKNDRGDYRTPIHAVAMCGTYVVIFPLGVIFLRLFERVRWHAWTQGAGTLIAISGGVLGLYMSNMYNKSKHINSAHQLTGLTILALTLTQFAFGLTHHLIFKKTQRPTILGRIHLYTGPFILLGGAANGFLGFAFSSTNRNLMYGIICGVVFVGLAAILFYARSKKAKKLRAAARFPVDETFDDYSHRDSSGVQRRAEYVEESESASVRLERVLKGPPPEYVDDRPVNPRSLV